MWLEVLCTDHLEKGAVFTGATDTHRDAGEVLGQMDMFGRRRSSQVTLADETFWATPGQLPRFDFGYHVAINKFLGIFSPPGSTIF